MPTKSKKKSAGGVSRKKKVEQPKRLVNKIALVFDRSGSMMTIREAARGAMAKLTEQIKELALTSEQDTYVDVIWFGHNVVHQFTDLPAEAVAYDFSQYYPNEGYTELFRATRDAINSLKARPGGTDEDVSYVVYVITDGHENPVPTRQPVSAKDLSKLISEVQSTDRWTLAFQVPHGNKAGLARLGIPDGNIVEWDVTEAGVKSAMSQTGQGLGVFYNSRATRAAGSTSTRSFYTTDLSKVSNTDLKKLKDISKDVRFLKVEGEEALRDFMERKLGQYTKGTAFYALTKDEDEVQDYKQILIAEKTSKNKKRKRVFAGAEARKLLGLPEQGTVKVRPGNHANYDVYIQSTSVNRKLVRGTRVAYLPTAAQQ